MATVFEDFERAAAAGIKSLAVLIDPEKFNEAEAETFLKLLPPEITHVFIGGSTAEALKTKLTVKKLKTLTNLPIVLFPGDHRQISEEADALLFLSLISGRNPEYLIEQQVKSVSQLKNLDLEIIPTGYILIDGGRECAVQRVSKTKPLPQQDLETIVNTALAGQFSGKKLVYLEAGSGADNPVSEEIISKVKAALQIPVIVGGGIRSHEQLRRGFEAGADVIVIGTAFEEGNFGR